MDINKVNDLIEKLNDSNEFPPWVKLLVGVMKELINEVKTITSLVNRVQELENCKVINDHVTELLKGENKNLNEKINKMTIQMDDQEQRSRNDCLLIHGIDEQVNDNTDNIALQVINQELGIELTVDGIQRSHRVGPKKETRNTRSSKPNPRPIIVRFANWRKRNEVFRAKKMLKGKRISISENLTKNRYNLLKEAIDKYGRGNVWTIDGRVTTKINDRYLVITCAEDIK